MATILITGVSSGIGYSTAQEFIRCGYQVFGSVRRDTDAQRLAAELGPDFIPLIFDITDHAAIQNAAQQVTTILSGEGLAGLINNAGIATSGPLMYQSIDSIRQQFEVNVIGPIALIQAVFPLLKQGQQQQPGKIINISSIRGQVPMPFIGAYTGSKHALEGISHSLRQELMLHGIDVIIISPGTVDTPIWGKESAQDMGQYSATEYAQPLKAAQAYMLAAGKSRYSSEKVAKLIRGVLEEEHPRVQYVIAPDPLANWILPKLIPHRLFDKIISKKLGLKRD